MSLKKFISTKEAALLIGIGQRSVTRWARKHNIESERRGRGKYYSLDDINEVLKEISATPGEGIASIAGIELENIRWCWVEDERGRRPFFCVEDIRRWLGTKYATARLIEDVPNAHKGVLSQHTLGGVQAMWHVSLGGLPFVISNSRIASRSPEDALRVEQLLTWAANVIEDVSLGKASEYVDPVSKVSEEDMRVILYVQRRRRSIEAGYRSQRLTSLGYQVEMCKMLELLGVDQRFIRQPTDENYGQLTLWSNDDVELDAEEDAS